jgi:hypothetical protein
MFAYVLRVSGVVGYLTAGRIEHDNEAVLVYNASGELNLLGPQPERRSGADQVGVRDPRPSDCQPETGIAPKR